MTLHSVFYTPAGALRAPWRAIGFFAVLIVSGGLATLLVGPILGGVYNAVGLSGQTVASVVQLISAVFATWVMLRHYDRKPWSDVGLHTAAARPGRLAGGFVIGALAIALPILSLILLGWLARAPATTTEWAGPTLRITMLLLPAAFSEELITRGYLLTTLRDALNWRWAVIITSVLFGLLHLQNPGANAQSVLLVALAGIFLAMVRIATDSLYAAGAAHFAWNWVMAAIFHAPVSGFAFELPGYRYVDAGPDWATGGGWGPESGIPAAITMIAGTGFLLMRLRRRSRVSS